MYFSQEPIFAPRIVWQVRGEWMAAAVTSRYEIRLYGHGVLKRIVRRQISAREGTRDLAIRNAPAVGVSLRGGPSCEMTGETILEQVGFEKVVPFIKDLILTPGGELWVLRNTLAGEARALDVFGPGGEYAGTVHDVLGIPSTFVSDSLIADVRKDTATGLPLIRMMRVRRGG